MGDEITHSEFLAADFELFDERLQQETRLLGQWFEDRAFSTRVPVCGLELEAWLIDKQARPAPVNRQFLDQMNDPLVVPELAKFNVELNVDPEPLHGKALSRLHRDLQRTWDDCGTAAAGLDTRLLMAGILPSVTQQDLTLENMSELIRYRALNEQVLRLRGGEPLKLDIHGREHLSILHNDVMLESATTSLQLHLKVSAQDAVRYYNAAQIVSAPLVAAAANSPYLFGKDLWDETRIPLFEQSVEVGGFAGASRGPVRRVSFGTGYAKESLFECYVENQQHFPVLLPVHFEAPDHEMCHLRLHNGTVWRWNRPLIGYDKDGTPHLRIEHRVLPAGPTVIDSIASAAFFYGLVHALAMHDVAPEIKLPFAVARDNFYAAARDGLDAQITWLDGRKLPVQTLLLDQLIPMARYGLGLLDIDQQDRDLYLGIVKDRIRNACTGASWQRAYVARHASDMPALTEAYYKRQQSGVPVHEWDS
ncbi:MAG: glutamate-cysteine ligase family protein [Gammaproteobacteria bacterium]|nr:MAG: glutamate-cysteine ligase family protein [Gammaproteobacteria bacterium]